jgi:hypothetical protein
MAVTIDPDVQNIILIVIGVFVGVIIGIILYYSYTHSYELFIAIFSIFNIIFISFNLWYLYLKKQFFSKLDFNISFGMDIFMLALSLIFFFFFGIKSLFFKSISPILRDDSRRY